MFETHYKYEEALSGRSRENAESPDLDFHLRDISSLYVKDIYKNNFHTIDIFYPRYAEHSHGRELIQPDRIRHILSFYPDRLKLIDLRSVFLRPLFIDAGNLELVGTYHRPSRTVVIYLHHPYFYQVEPDSLSITNYECQRFRDRLIEDIASNIDEFRLNVHPLWYILSIIKADGTNQIDRFYIKKSTIGSKHSRSLISISNYYCRLGY